MYFIKQKWRLINGNIKGTQVYLKFGQCRYRKDPSNDIIPLMGVYIKKREHEEGFLVGRHTTSRNNPT